MAKRWAQGPPRPMRVKRRGLGGAERWFILATLGKVWLAMLPRAWTPPGCDPGVAWSSYHTGNDLLSGLEVPHWLRPG